MKPCKTHIDCDPDHTTCILGHRNPHECPNYQTDLEVAKFFEGLKNGSIVPVPREDEPLFLGRLGEQWIADRVGRSLIEVLIEQNAPIKALCWKQPFASLMLPPYNKVETRTHKTNIRGLVLIVATKSPFKSEELVKLCGGEQALNIELKIAGHDGYINGAAIGIGILSECDNIKEGDKTFIDPKNHVGRFAWRFTNVFAIEPIPMAGFQGWRDVDNELRAKIKLL